MGPVSPPVMNKETKPMENSSGVVKRIRPRQIVAIQLKVLMAEGTAMAVVRAEKAKAA